MIGNLVCITPIDDIKNFKDRLSSIKKLNLIYLPHCNKEELEKINNCDVLFVNPNQLNFRIDKKLIKKCNIKHVITASTGINHIDVDFVEFTSLTKSKKITNNISSTAEHAFALTLSLLRNIPQSFDDVKKGNWSWENYTGRQLKELTVGIIGYGRLGKFYYKYARSMCKKVMFYDPYVKGGNTLKEIQNESDIISLHVHLTDETKKMINFEFIKKCKKKPYLINTSRGGIVNEKDIVKSLKNNLLSGYATDVLEGELNYSIKSELIKNINNYNIIITPHIGGMTKEARELAYNGVLDLYLKKINE